MTAMIAIGTYFGTLIVGSAFVRWLHHRHLKKRVDKHWTNEVQ